MFPNLFSTLRLVFREFLATQLNQVSRLSLGEVLIQAKGILIIDFVDETVAPKHPSYHVSNNLFVILNLALIVFEDCLGNFGSRSLATALQQRHEHNWLVDVGHSHSVLNEILKSSIIHRDSRRSNRFALHSTWEYQHLTSTVHTESGFCGTQVRRSLKPDSMQQVSESRITAQRVVDGINLKRRQQTGMLTVGGFKTFEGLVVLL